jgi:hypothetical protein
MSNYYPFNTAILGGNYVVEAEANATALGRMLSAYFKALLTLMVNAKINIEFTFCVDF